MLGRRRRAFAAPNRRRRRGGFRAAARTVARANPAAQCAAQIPPRGTADAVARALPLCGRDSLVVALCADSPLLRAATLRRLAARAGGGIALLSTVAPNPAGYGRIERASPRGAARAIVEEKNATAAQKKIGEVFAGALAAPAALLRRELPKIKIDKISGEKYLTGIVAHAVRAQIPVAVCAAPFCETAGINTPADLAAAEDFFLQAAAADLIRQGVVLSAPRRLAVKGLRGQIRARAGAVIEGDAVLRGAVFLGAGAVVAPHCVIEDSTIGAGARIESFSHLAAAVVGARCVVGPFARLRAGTVLRAGAKIGNFVEAKNARVGAAAKANHLAYLGDCDIGAAANIGAGAVTCNFDGRKKHRTKIGRGAFVGSNVSLVAPVRVGADAVVGAGSVVARDAPRGRVTIARARQIDKPRKGARG